MLKARLEQDSSGDAQDDAQSVFRRLEIEQQNQGDKAVTSLRTLSPDELKAFEAGLAQAAAAKYGTNYADAGSHSGDTTATDAGGGSDQQAQAQQLTEAKAQASQAASAVGLMNSIIGLQHWGDMSDLQRTAALASIYNVIDKITENALPGDLGTAASALGLLNALNKGDVGSMLVSSVSLINAVTEDMASKAIGSALGIDAADVVPGIGLVLAIESGNPMSIAAAAANFIPIYGQFLSVAISVFGDVFGDDPPDIPTREGLAHAQWDTAGNTEVITDQDIEGGGPTATGWMTSMVNGLQAQLANVHDAAGNSYALVPDLLPAIGFVHNPDGYNIGNGTNGFVYLKWTDEDGQSKTRYYDGAGNRSDGTGETLAGDFMQHAARAIAPAWAVATTLAHYQQGLGIHLPSAEAGMPQEAADGTHQTLQAITLALPVEPALQNALIDVDADGYLERTQWLATNQQVLAIDVDGNKQISVNELLSLDGPDSRHSLGWLDADGDQMLTDRDPAFAALRLWMDVNADAESVSETQTLAQAGIVAIDFGSLPPAIVHADSGRQALTVQMLAGDVLGVQYEAVEGGILQLDEQASGPAAATLHALNMRGFDGQTGHIHGGAADTDGGDAVVDAGDGRLATTSANTIATQSAQTSASLAAGDGRLRIGLSGNTLSGQGTAQTAGTAQVRNNGIVFVPAGAAGVGAQMREATEDMVRSADAGSLAPLAALAAGAAAVQWPMVATAAASQVQDTNAAAVFVPATQAEPALIDLQTWETSRVSAAVPISPAQEPSQAATSVTWGAAPRQAGGGATAAAPERLAPLEWTSPTIAPPVIAANGDALAAASAPVADIDDNVGPAANITAPLAPSTLSTSTPLDYPEVHGEQVNSLEDTGLRFLETQLLSNDSTVNEPARPDEPSLRISSVFAPVHGSVSLQTNAQGVLEVVFLPEENYHGPASFDYTVTDQYGLSNNARVSLVIAAVNDAPVTQDENAFSTEDTVLYFAPGDLLASASDVDKVTDGQQLSISSIVTAQHGVAVLMPDGRIRFTPDADYNAGIDGPASFTYNVNDGAGGVTPATVWVSLAASNDAPDVQDELIRMLEDEVVSIAATDLLANDSDVDNPHADLRISAVSNAAHGSVAIQAQPDGSSRIVFTPEADYHGQASFDYTVTDPGGQWSHARVNLDIAAVGDAPVTQDGNVSSTEDTVLYFTPADLLANASDADSTTDGQQLSVSAIVAAQHGVATLMPDGRVRFTPDADYNQDLDGPASFTYSVSDGAGGVTPATVWVSLAAANDAPRLQSESTSTQEDKALNIASADLLANDFDVDNLHTDLRISAVSEAVHGSAALQVQPDGNSRIVFTPEADYHGIASFSYTVTDLGGASSTATARIVVGSVNDAPLTQDSQVSGTEDTALYFATSDLLAGASDADTATDGQQLSISSIVTAQHGVAVLMPDGRIRFTPDSDYNQSIDGLASFTYSVSDGAGGVTPATVWVSLAAVNDAPRLQGETVNAVEDQILSIATADLLANDRDVDDSNADLRTTAVSDATHGSVMLQVQPDGSNQVVFTPEANFHGIATFRYTVTDPSGASSSATTQVVVASVNDAPVTQDSQMFGMEDTAVYLTRADLLANASDVDANTDGQQLSVSAVVAANHGVATLMPDGRVRFTPDSDYNQSIDGLASFTYNVSDGAGGVTPATVWLSLAAVNDAPRLQDESANALEDQVLSIATVDLLANDSDVDNLHADLRISTVSDATHGSAVLQTQADGSSRVIFTPEANYHGCASFRYTVTDPSGASSAATAQIVLAAVNDAPVTQDGNVSGMEDTVLYFASTDLLASTSDPDTTTDGQRLSIGAITAARHGEAVLMPDGRIRFTPDADYNAGIDGPASFTYNVIDGAGGVTPATVWVSLAAVNDAPRLQDETTNALEDQALSISTTHLLANDSDVDNLHAGLRVSSVSDAVHGSVALQLQPDGSSRVVFTPEANYHGIASFRYTVTDPGGASSMATARIVLAAVNDAPVTQGETAIGSEDTALLYTAASLLANDSDVDTSLDGDVPRITRVGLAEHGQVFLQADGTVRFEPEANYNGPAKFSYWIGDRTPAQIAAGEGYETAATVNLTILAVNDLPVVTGETLGSSEDIVLTINPALLLANDTDVDTVATHAEPAQVLSITAVGNAQHGSIALLANGALQFTPEPNFFGAAGFSYTVSDGRGGQVQGQVALNLAAINDSPTVLGETVSFNEDQLQTFTQAQFLANDSDEDNSQGDLRIVSVENATHGVVSLNPNGTIRFAPDVDYFGPAQFTYTVSDGAGGFTVGLASLAITPVNDAPRLTGETATLNEDTQARFSSGALLANDSDVDNAQASLLITAVGNASHGSVQIAAGEVVFTPDLNYSGPASFTYTVSDGAGGTSQATVNLSFNAVNDAPVVNSELVWGKRNVSYTLTQAALLANDTDVESPAASLRISAINNAQHGTAVLNADGSVRFTPEVGYAGRGSFDYVVQDPQGASSTATAQIDFSRVNVNPTATDDSFMGYEDIPFSITQAQLLVNDGDADNAASDLRVTAVGSASNGTVSLQADGSVRFVPSADFYGTASFSYQVSDGDGGQTWATARLNVQSVNDAPVIDEIIFGQPVYGYLPGAVAPEDIAIYDEAQALSLANIGLLYSRTYNRTIGDSEGLSVPIYDYALVTPTYYRNGHMRPVFVEIQDATFQDPNNIETKWMYPGDGTRPTDDPYRQNGYIVAYDPDGNSGAISFAIAGSPQRGHAWANQYTAHSTARDSSYTVAHWYAVGQTGAWQYYSQRGDPYSGADPFTVAVTDGGGATTYVTVSTAQVGSLAPVALDLDGGGLQYLGLDVSRASFDVDQKGGHEHLAWVAPGDALLARDIGGEKLISRADEISFTSYLPGAQTDLEGLAAFDSNNNHMLDRGDEKWIEFGAWNDKNSNGISEAGEFRSLDEVGITQIELQSDQQIRQPAQGVTEVGQSNMRWADGHTSAVGDVVLAVVAESSAPSAAEQVAPSVPLTPQAMALQMVHLIATATAEWERMREGGPLGAGGTEIHGPQNVHEAMTVTQVEWEQSAQSAFSQWHAS